MARAILRLGAALPEVGKHLKMKCISFSCLFAIAALVMPGESGIGKAYAHASFDGAWSVQITMDRGNCDPINGLSVVIREGVLQYAGDSAVSVHGQVVNDGQVRVRLISGGKSGSGSGRLSASSGAGTWHGSGLASSCAGHWSAERH
jgi:hypothetical protein